MQNQPCTNELDWLSSKRVDSRLAYFNKIPDVTAIVLIVPAYTVIKNKCIFHLKISIAAPQTSLHDGGAQELTTLICWLTESPHFSASGPAGLAISLGPEDRCHASSWVGGLGPSAACHDCSYHYSRPQAMVSPDRRCSVRPSRRCANGAPVSHMAADIFDGSLLHF